MTTYPAVACNAPFTSSARGRFPRAGVRRRAGASIITIWMAPGRRMAFMGGKAHAVLSSHAEAVDIGLVLSHFLRQEIPSDIGAGR